MKKSKKNGAKSTAKRGESGAKRNEKVAKVDDSSSAQASLSGIHRSLSLVAQVERALRTAIENDVFPNGRLPTLLELSEQLRVSRETVRLALEPLQKEGLVVKHRRRGTFVRLPEVPMKLSRPRSKVLGYLCEELGGRGGADRPCSSQMLQGAVFEASQRGYQLNIRSVKFSQLQETFHQMEASGVMRGVIFETVVEEKFIQKLSGRGIPAILLDHEMQQSSIGSIRSDSQQNAGLAVKRLAELGHRRIACVHWRQSDLNPWFIQGYRLGMRDERLRCRQVWQVFAELSPQGAAKAAEQLLTLSPCPTAILCFHNTFASQFLQAASERGFRVPADISVVGCGGERVVGLSHTQLDWSAMGRSAVQMLLRAVDQDKACEPEHLLVPYEWREGSTTATSGG